MHQLNELLDSNAQLKTLYMHIKKISILNKHLSQYLVMPLKNHCTVAHYNNDILLINTDSSVWATKLRYCVPDILHIAKLKWGLSNLKTVRVNISPISNHHSTFTETVYNKKLALSKRSADFIESIAESIEDVSIKNALLRISNHGK